MQSKKETQEQDEIANPTAPTVKPDKTRPIYPSMSISAWQLNYPSQPKPNKAADLFDSDSE